MKKYKKNMAWAFGLVVAFVLMSGKLSSVSAQQAIVPAAGNGSVYQYQITADQKMIAVPVQISQAGAVELEVDAQTGSEIFAAILSTSAAASNRGAWLAQSTSETSTLLSYAKGACIWYLHLGVDGLETGGSVSVTVRARYRSALTGDGTLQKGKWASYYIEGKSSGYYKIKVPSTGCLKFELKSSNENASFTLALFNGKKKKISKDVYESHEAYYGVKKGTYYMKATNEGGKGEGEICDLRFTFEKIKHNKNTKESKAVSLKRGKTAKGIFLCGEKKTARWYKIKLDKNKTVKWKITTNVNAPSCGFSIYQGPRKAIKTLVMFKRKSTWKLKLEKGTYYFVMNIFNEPSEGCYSIQWK